MVDVGAVRSILLLVARGAARFHDGPTAFHQRLSNAGKPLMVIRIAIGRKLLVILNTEARHARKQYAYAT
jgi:transposase